jgi:hypothetical protein
VLTLQQALPGQASLRRYHLAAFAALVIAVGASLVLPIAGPVTVAATITLLRASDRARRKFAARCGTHRPRARDRIMLTAALPWLLLRSVAATILLAPLLSALAGIVAAGIVVAVPAFALHGWHPLPAGVAFAAAYSALSCVGPGSRGARRELHRSVGAIASTPLTAAMAMLAAGAVAIAIVSLAFVRGSAPWPVPALYLHLPAMNAVRASVSGWAP